MSKEKNNKEEYTVSKNGIVKYKGRHGTIGFDPNWNKK